MKTCPNCNHAVSDTAKFCVKCGFNIKKHEEELQQEHFCPECGTKFSGGDFCPECGTKFSDGEFRPESSTNISELLNETSPNAPILDLGSIDFSSFESAAQNKLHESELAAFEHEQLSNGKYVIKALKNKSELIITVPNAVQMIEADAFANSSVIDVTLPEGLIKIGARAFANCADLEKINIPSTVKIIEDEAFLDCAQLNIAEQEGIRYGKNALKGTILWIKKENERKRKEEEERKRKEEEERKRQEEKRIKESIEAKKRQYTEGLKFKKKGDGYAVVGYTGKEVNVVIPEIYAECPVVEISDNAFYNEKIRIESISIPQTIEYIGSGAFAYCSSLTNISIPESVKYIGGGAFISCQSLTSITIPNLVIVICAKAFENCTSLTSIVIPNSVTRIGASAFSHCTSLKNIEIPDSVTSIDFYAFDTCSSLECIKLPKTLTEVDTGLFANCSKLKLIEVPTALASMLIYPDKYSERRMSFRKYIENRCHAQIIEY